MSLCFNVRRGMLMFSITQQFVTNIETIVSGQSCCENNAVGIGHCNLTVIILMMIADDTPEFEQLDERMFVGTQKHSLHQETLCYTAL